MFVTFRSKWCKNEDFKLFEISVLGDYFFTKGGSWYVNLFYFQIAKYVVEWSVSNTP